MVSQVLRGLHTLHTQFARPMVPKVVVAITWLPVGIVPYLHFGFAEVVDNPLCVYALEAGHMLGMVGILGRNLGLLLFTNTPERS